MRTTSFELLSDAPLGSYDYRTTLLFPPATIPGEDTFTFRVVER